MLEDKVIFNDKVVNPERSKAKKLLHRLNITKYNR
jgi:hypothetical protein